MIYTDKHAIQFILNGYEYTPNDIRIDKLIIYESAQLHVPTLEIDAELPEIKFAQFVMSDVLEGKLIISRRENNQMIEIVNMPIKYNNSKSTSNIETMQIQMLFDFNWKEGYSAKSEAISGPSSSVFKKFGLESGFKKIYVASTSDMMTWINPNYRGIKFLNEVCKAAYSSPESCFQWGIRSDNSLIFRDITKRNTEKVANLVLGDINTIVNYSIDSKPVSLNRLYGYGRACIIYDYQGNTIRDMNKIVIKPLGERASISNQGNQGSYSIPINCGNTHENYQRAIVQNLRVKSTFNTNIKFSLVQDNTNLNLLDDITIVNNSKNYSTLSKLKGIITGRSILIEKNKMNYTISVDTNGFNTGDIS